MELIRRDEVEPFEFADITLRELTPKAFDLGSIAEVTVPMGAVRPARVNRKTHRIYHCLQGEIEFTVDGRTLRLRPGDVLHIAEGEEYGFHNGGYEEGCLLLIRVPGPSLPENY